MASIAVTVAISRVAPLPTSDLDLGADPYVVEAFNAGNVLWRRERVVSPYTHGAYLVAALRDVSELSIDVRVSGSSAANYEANLAALLAAVSQFEYELTFEIEGLLSTWTCEPADYGLVDSAGINKHHARLLQQQWRLIIPKHPIPIAGPN